MPKHWGTIAHLVNLTFHFGFISPFCRPFALCTHRNVVPRNGIASCSKVVAVGGRNLATTCLERTSCRPREPSPYWSLPSLMQLLLSTLHGSTACFSNSDHHGGGMTHKQIFYTLPNCMVSSLVLTWNKRSQTGEAWEPANIPLVDQVMTT